MPSGPLDAGDLAHLEHLRARRDAIAAEILANGRKAGELARANKGLAGERARIEAEVLRLVMGGEVKCDAFTKTRP